MPSLPPDFRKRLTLACGALVLALVAAEGWFRMRQATGWEFLLTDTPSLYDLSIFQPDDELGQVLRPGAKGRTRTPEFMATTTINSLGVRGAELGAKTNGEFRILAVGDSFTLGLQVADDATFSALAAKDLSQQTGRTVRLLNVGVDGYGTHAATRLAMRMAPAVEADAVLLTFFLGNDFWDNQNFAHVRQQPPLVQKHRDVLSSTVASRSALYNYLRLAWGMRAASRNPQALERRQEELSVYLGDAGLAPRLPATRAALAEFGQACSEANLVCYLALAPPAYGVDPARAAATLAYFDLDPAALDLSAAASAVAQAAPEGMAIVDLGPALRAEPDPGDLYFPLDGHWTELGHRAAAETLSAFLAPLLAGE